MDQISLIFKKLFYMPNTLNIAVHQLLILYAYIYGSKLLSIDMKKLM